jgi:antitoxin HicB
MKKDKEITKYPFEVTILPEDGAGGGFFITYPDLPGCMSDGKTLEDVLKNGQDAVWYWLKIAKSLKQEIPKPGKSHSGQYVQRLPKSLHARLAAMAKAENISMNKLALSFIAAGIGKGFR